MEKFTIGLALGMVGGALLVVNNYKARQVVRKSQEEMEQKMEQFLDKKLGKCEGQCDGGDSE